MILVNIEKRLKTLLGDANVEVNKPLKNHTYTRLGGNADYFVTPKTAEQVQEVVRLANECDIPFMLLGNGSNLIIKDGGIRGIVMYLGEFNEIEVVDTTVRAQSGALIADVSKEALHYHLTGLEFACGIPGSVGGALFMNAGAYGGEIKDVLKEAIVITPDGELLTIQAEDLHLSYRTSSIQTNGYIVLEALFELEVGKYGEIKSMMDVLTYKRESKQPLEYPTCGSVFKRPPGNFAGKLIQDSGLQGVQIGGAEVSKKHAGFIINKDEATASEYIALIKHVQKVVKENFDVELEREVRIIGEDK
ncbi:MAG TPA: UDP-N-acetylmuramate dehydrogenase [Candidatus Pseudogracilibacillus intestinigallinarum]|uniref:UDP-N-acetylenolpyruvoylglucosamine reductase n=1 Tax=Candidatus Pseudogracilibacillus intestinigallinarum TaxID=2838742 RepID=A0A9D1PKX5_9BACI|nr:UDP-N-acetylmuramate dehydrogenase [Candidatus Pseudogracilibacillus intestinigallinarum]